MSEDDFTKATNAMDAANHHGAFGHKNSSWNKITIPKSHPLVVLTAG